MEAMTTKFCLILLLLLTPAVNGDVVVRAVEITAFGVFQEYGKQFERGYSASGPGTYSLEYVRFIDFKREIPGELGINFGIQYIIHSTPKGKPFKVTGVITYPEPGLASPDGELYKNSQEDMIVNLGEKNFYGFGFDKPWEIIPGEWKFQIKHNDAVLAQKTLVVLDPERNQAL
jgi:hypothetical protein